MLTGRKLLSNSLASLKRTGHRSNAGRNTSTMSSSAKTWSWTSIGLWSKFSCWGGCMSSMDLPGLTWAHCCQTDHKIRSKTSSTTQFEGQPKPSAVTSHRCWRRQRNLSLLKFFMPLSTSLISLRNLFWKEIIQLTTIVFCLISKLKC